MEPPSKATHPGGDRNEALRARGGSSVSLSVIVPVYNSSADLERCLAALSASTFERFEVVVVDDGSTEPIASIVEGFGYRYLRIDGPGGPARARNRGVAQSTAPHVVFIDADVLVHPDTLQRFAEAFAADPSVDAVIGTYDDEPGHPGFLSQYKNLFHHYVHQAGHGEASTFWSGCGAIKRDLFLKVGGFDEVRYRRPAIEDIELGTWLAAAGHRIVLDSRIRCKHLKRWTLRNLLKTDVLDRGVPWTRLMLRAGKLPNTLNVTVSQRISVALAGLVVVSLMAGWWRAEAMAVAGALLVALVLLNHDFYRYFAARRGWWFTVRVAPLHWLYFLYCGVGFALGTLLYYWHGDGRRGNESKGGSMERADAPAP
ncbi:MAG: glycosyltransferase family 2 protein [Planctomycetes bacterium]|nr:glycosyltransferase family 2 protein [Planctomycetota bacterium]